MSNTKFLSTVFFPLYIFSFYLSFSVLNPFLVWVGLEINLLGFLGVLKLTNTNKTEIQTLKYFLPQALGSAFILVGILCFESLPFFLGAALILKLGLFPFHSWFISVRANISYFGLWLISIPQKIIPFLLVLSLNFLASWIIVLGGRLVAVTNIVNTRRMGEILGYSSLFNMRWFLCVCESVDMLIFFFRVYGFSLILVTFFFRKRRKAIKAEINIQIQSWEELLKLLILILNLAGVPPLLNIWRKRIFLHVFLDKSWWGLLRVFVACSLVLRYAYLRVCINYRFLSSVRFHKAFEHRHDSRARVLLIASTIIFFL